MPMNDFTDSGLVPPGRFLTFRHEPSYRVRNMRQTELRRVLGHLDNGEPVVNHVNFPEGDFYVDCAEPVWEIPNAFPCWGTTYILSDPADRMATVPASWRFRADCNCHDSGFVSELAKNGLLASDGRCFTLEDLPDSLLIAIAGTNRDTEVLERVATLACDLEMDISNRPVGMRFEKRNGIASPCIKNRDLFKAVVANPHLPDDYKSAMILMPGIQGGNPIVGEYRKDDTHVWEYLRANSYIPWGHFASNMAQDAVRYSIKELALDDMTGLRHLFYQRIFVKMYLSLAECSVLSENDMPCINGCSSAEELDRIRLKVIAGVRAMNDTRRILPFNAVMWGWNYGFGISHAGYRMHASNQQIHQQFALIPTLVTDKETGDEAVNRNSYAAGDHAAKTASAYRERYGRSFFDDYINAIKQNRRVDRRTDLARSLVIYEDNNAMLYVPKAQRSQAELHIIALRQVDHILNADGDMRASLDFMIWLAVRLLAEAGAEMVTCFEMSGRFDRFNGTQRLMYCFLPRHPLSPGAFSERQGRWITGHYPEDVAHALRKKMKWISLPSCA